AMDEGRLPRRNGVRPHLTLTTTPEALQGLVGAAASELEHGGMVSSQTAQRLACDGTLCRVLTAGSVVTDVGRATRAIYPATKRALRVRDKGCRWPGCDRPLSWSSAHHIEFWTRGGETRLGNLVTLCWYHHRCVHEGGWQVVRSGSQLRFIPPDRVPVRRARGAGMRWAA
ncbi:MAG TPA: HNH endonuclease, partial [Candidatus Dormibacteraeota bacterium]|nr:HNH endonuclease [Candidatus Dormibacteraeota bacterium]